jgi:hypothetical protein
LLHSPDGREAKARLVFVAPFKCDKLPGNPKTVVQFERLKSAAATTCALVAATSPKLH